MKKKLLMWMILFSLIQFSATGRLQSERWGDVKQVLPRVFNYGPPPPPYEAYSWTSGRDFADIRDIQVPMIKGLNVVAWSTLGAVIGALAGGAAGFSIGLGAGQTLPAGMNYFADGIANLVTSGGEWSFNWAFPVRLSELINRLDSELGISDYYVFVELTGPNILSSGVTIPLGAWVRLDFNALEHRRVYRTLNEKDIPIVGANPLVFRLGSGALDFDKIDARIFERDLSGKDRVVTINTVFTYEYFQGRTLPKGSQDKTHQKLTVLHGHPDPEHGGKIIGKAELKYLPGIGNSGLREIHLCSPVNNGLVFNEGDAFAFAINLDANTVTVELISSGDQKPKVDEELAIRVFVKGLHNPPASHVDASDGVHYLWKEIATQTFHDAKCEGAGVTDTQIQHDEQYTTLRCTPTEDGDVNVVLQTVDGPVKFKAASIESEDPAKGRSRKYYLVDFWAADKPYDGQGLWPDGAKIPIAGTEAHFSALEFRYGTQWNSISFGGEFRLRGTLTVANHYFPARDYSHPDFSTRGTGIKAKVDPGGRFRVQIPDKNRYSLLILEGQLSSDFKSASGVIRVAFLYDGTGTRLPPPGITVEARWRAQPYKVIEYYDNIKK